MEWKRFVWCASQTCWCQSSQVFGRVCLCIRHECTECQACEGSLAYMLYWNNAYLYTVHADLFNHKGSAQALFCKSPCWRSKRSHAPSSSPKLASKLRDESDACLNGWIRRVRHNLVPSLFSRAQDHAHHDDDEDFVHDTRHVSSSCFASNPRCPCCWCL